MQNCKLSIIMPVYNTSKYLNRSISSIIYQSFKDWELIIVDDGSTDDSYSICKEYSNKDERIKLFKQNNSGAGPARNKGIENSMGEYITFPDSDDWIDSKAYEKCIRLMSEEKLDLLMFGSINTTYDDLGNVISETKGTIDNITLKNQKDCRDNWTSFIKKFPMDGPSNKIYRTSIIKENNIIFPNMRRMQDGVFNMNYYDKISSFMMIDDYFYHFTQHSLDFQKKKYKDDYVDCVINYHKTAISNLESWRKINERETFDKWFIETIVDYEFDGNNYFGDSHKEIYKKIEKINNNPYVRDVFNRYDSIKQLDKRSSSIKNNWNMLNATYIKFRKEK